MTFNLGNQGTARTSSLSLSEKVPLEVTVIHAAAVATENKLAVVTYRNILLLTFTTDWNDGNLVTSNDNSLLIVMISVNVEDEPSASLVGGPELIVLGEPVKLWVRL
jgi:hypothetical protein